MISGRQAELAAIDDVLADVRLRRSRTLLFEGEAGIGKTALLDYAASRCDGLRLLVAKGTESEAELAFATLHQLLWPLLAGIERLPGPQAVALRSAFGLTASPTGGPDRFLLGAATLTLLADAADSQSMVCLIDDLQWVDGPSVDALQFVARRIHAEGIAILAAARSDGTASDGQSTLAADLPRRRLSGLSPAAAVEAMCEWYPDLLAPEVIEELAVRVGGSPLALREIPRLLSPEQRAGHDPLPDPLPAGRDLERAFLYRFRDLPAVTQRLLEVAAADGTADLDAVLRAAGVSDLENADPAERIGLVRVTDTALEFSHPLLRSAVYGAMPTARRWQVHEALADVLRDSAPDRWAWHLAAARRGPDPMVAGLLESTADRARRRSGYAAAATAMARAAELSATPSDRARLLVRAAGDAWSAGQVRRGQQLLDQAAQIEEHDQAAVARLRGHFQLRAGLPAQALETLLEGARHDQEPLSALEMLMAAAEAAGHAGDPTQIATIGQQAAALPAEGERAAYLSLVLTGTAALFGGDQERGLTRLAEADRLASSFDDPAYLRWATYNAIYIGSDETERRYTRLVSRLRALGAIGDLPNALQFPAVIHALTGQFDQALTEADEGLRLARDTGQGESVAVLLAAIATVAALRGQAEECNRYADDALDLAEPRRQGMAVGFANWAQAMLELGLGRPERALQFHDKIVHGGPGRTHPAIAGSSLAWHIDAAVQAGRMAEARAAMERLGPWVDRAGPYYAPMLAYCRARLAEGSEAAQLYRQALELTDGAREPFAWAQRHLGYGQHLRRQRQRSEARTHLREALAAFSRLGCTPWAQRAQDELRATGETARRGPVSTPVALTPQEAQITTLVIDGLSNREIAAQLFLSSRTVEYHLRKVFQKLGISSRTELIRPGGPVPTTTSIEHHSR